MLTFKYIASILPDYLMTEIDIVYVGQFDELNKKCKCYFEDGAIFATNDQTNEMDFIDDIVQSCSLN